MIADNKMRNENKKGLVGGGITEIILWIIFIIIGLIAVTYIIKKLTNF